MGKWLDLAREMREDVAVSSVSADSPTNCANSTNCNAALPRPIVEGLHRLSAARVPRWTNADRWGVFVSDARWLADYGIALDAIGRGWSPVDLFGISRDESWQSLAAWINGRRDEHGRACILLTEIRCDRSLPYAVHARDGRHCWHYPEPAPADARLPWTK